MSESFIQNLFAERIGGAGYDKGTAIYNVLSEYMRKLTRAGSQVRGAVVNAIQPTRSADDVTALDHARMTSDVGAVLLTGYLGGAVVTHVRAGEPLVALSPVLLGAMLWGSLWFRDARVKALLPTRQ